MDELHQKYDVKDYIYYNGKEDKTIVYNYQAKSKNLIFYKCNIKPKCDGAGKLNNHKSIYNN